VKSVLTFSTAKECFHILILIFFFKIFNMLVADISCYMLITLIWSYLCKDSEWIHESVGIFHVSMLTLTNLCDENCCITESYYFSYHFFKIKL